MSEASIVLLTYNGQKYLEQLLQMIARQKRQPLEVLAIDSTSTDSTPEILRKFQIPTKTILKDQFSHPATRNMAVPMCSGKYIVFLTQDAVPADSCWLECLLRPFEEFENVAGVYSRQIPRPGTSLLEENDIRLTFSSERIVKKLNSGETPGHRKLWELIKFSNSSGAYVRNLLLKNPFMERLEMAEDQEWTKRALEQNYAVVYEPASVVVHSHEHLLAEKYARNLSLGKSFSTFLKSTLGERSTLLEVGAMLNHMYLDLGYIYSCEARFKEKLKWFALSPIHRCVIHFAFRKGWNAEKICTPSAEGVMNVIS